VRAALICVLVTAATAARAQPAPDDQAALALLDKIAKAPDAESRKTAAAELVKLAPKVVDALGKFVARKHDVAVEDRRKVLEQIKAQVPDKTGRFPAFERKSAKEEQADDDLDWLAEMGALDPSTTGLGEVTADDAAIRALASTKDVAAAQHVFDTAFGEDTIIYRDECGRYLRRMSPYSIPPLLVESQGKNFDRKRYATYQLERLDRQEPGHALAAAAGDEALTIAILDAFRTTHYREAVHAVWTKVAADSPRVRAAARAAWDAYITGPPPPPAPRKKLQLPGGKLTKKEKPLWLTYRELADNELRKAANELLHEDYPLEDPTLDDSDEWRHKKTVKVDLEDLTKRLFEFYDQQRAKKEGEQWAAAKALADKGDVAGATAALDRLLAANPERDGRADMAKVYFTYAKQLEGNEKWSEAAAAYSKAQGLDPKGPNGVDALAAAYYTLGKSLEAQGKDGGPDFRRAVALRPDYAPAKSAEHAAEMRGKPVWMLYGAGLAVVAAAGLFAFGMLRRKARA
jgi:tetratricopeptide (TPR) repeat protein